MADNIQLNVGADGDLLAAIDIGGVKFQQMIPTNGDGSDIFGYRSADGVNGDVIISGGNWVGDTYTGAGEQKPYEYVNTSLQTDEAGTLFYDFSIDGSNWSAFPVAGFDVVSGIHEYHSAQKGQWRHFRPRFVGTGGRTYFRLLTAYTNVQVTLNSPLSQGVSSDQDASTVKAILHGEDADNAGTFVQQKFTSDGAALVSADSSLINFAYDAVDLTEVNAITERWDYFVGGLSGTRTAYITNVYSDSSKLVLISSERTNV